MVFFLESSGEVKGVDVSSRKRKLEDNVLINSTQSCKTSEKKPKLSQVPTSPRLTLQQRIFIDSLFDDTISAPCNGKNKNVHPLEDVNQNSSMSRQDVCKKRQDASKLYGDKSKGSHKPKVTHKDGKKDKYQNGYREEKKRVSVKSPPCLTLQQRAFIDSLFDDTPSSPCDGMKEKKMDLSYKCDVKIACDESTSRESDVICIGDNDALRRLGESSLSKRTPRDQPVRDDRPAKATGFRPRSSPPVDMPDTPKRAQHEVRPSKKLTPEQKVFIDSLFEDPCPVPSHVFNTPKDSTMTRKETNTPATVGNDRKSLRDLLVELTPESDTAEDKATGSCPSYRNSRVGHIVLAKKQLDNIKQNILLATRKQSSFLKKQEGSSPNRPTSNKRSATKQISVPISGMVKLPPASTHLTTVNNKPATKAVSTKLPSTSTLHKTSNNNSTTKTVVTKMTPQPAMPKSKAVTTKLPSDYTLHKTSKNNYTTKTVLIKLTPQPAIPKTKTVMTKLPPAPTPPNKTNNDSTSKTAMTKIPLAPTSQWNHQTSSLTAMRVSGTRKEPKDTSKRYNNGSDDENIPSTNVSGANLDPTMISTSQTNQAETVICSNNFRKSFSKFKIPTKSKQASPSASLAADSPLTSLEVHQAPRNIKAHHGVRSYRP